MDLLSMLLDDMHLRGATMIDLDVDLNQRLRWPQGERAVFHIVISGRTSLRIAGSDTPQALETGDVVIIPSGHAHDIGLGQEGQSLQFEELITKTIRLGSGQERLQLLSGQAKFDPELARPFMTALPNVLFIPGERGQLPPWIRIGLEFIRQEMAAELPAQQTIVNRMSDILLIECLRRFVATLEEDSQSWLLALHDPALSRALAALHAKPDEAWTVRTLAAKANLSRSAFAERFKKCLRQSPMAYLTAHRLRLAAWQLRHTSQPVGAIAEGVGYGSAAAFNQAFVRVHGCSPRRYREHGQAQPEDTPANDSP